MNYTHLLIGVLFLSYNIFRFKTFLKPDEEKKKEIEERLEFVNKFLSKEKLNMQFIIAASLVSGTIIFFYLLGGLIFKQLFIFSIILIILEIIVFTVTLRQLLTENIKSNMLNKISAPLSMTFNLLFLYFVIKF